MTKKAKRFMEEEDSFAHATRWLPLFIIVIILIVGFVYLQASRVTIPETATDSEEHGRTADELAGEIDESSKYVLDILPYNTSASWLTAPEIAGIESVPMPSPKTASAPITKEALDRILAKEKEKFRKAVEFVAPDGFINSDRFYLKDIIGEKVVLVSFWSFSSVNSLQAVEYLKLWDEKYHDLGLQIIGVHTPEFGFEKDIGNIEAAVERLGIRYPIIIDNGYYTWRAYQNRFWPSFYLIDIDGFMMLEKHGAGSCEAVEQEILELLEERKDALGLDISIPSSGVMAAHDTDYSLIKTPNIYLGYLKNRGDLGNQEGFLANMPVIYSLPAERVKNVVYLEGEWFNHDDNMELRSGKGRIIVNYDSKEVNIVAGGGGKLDINIDGVTASGRDVKEGSLFANDFRLYNIVAGDVYGEHELIIDISNPGFRLYSISFG